MTIKKSGAVLLAALICLSGASIGLQGCNSGPADGKLQIMYSGNFRGNVAPCG